MLVGFINQLITGMPHPAGILDDFGNLTEPEMFCLCRFRLFSGDGRSHKRNLGTDIF